MKRLYLLLLVALFVFPLVGCATKGEEKAITIFAGAASKPPLEEVGQAFEKNTGIKVYFNFGGSGTMLSQMKLSKSGDLYIPGSPDYMVMAERNGVVKPESVRIVAYLLPVIAVQHGNPKNIASLSDLAKPGLKIGIGNPQAVCVGLYAIEVLDYNNLLEAVGKNIVTHAESCEKTATLLALKSVDAVIGWDVFAKWDPDNIDAIYLKPEQIPRIAYIPGAISTFTKERDRAQRFLDFLVSPSGREIFSQWGYMVTESEARKFAPQAKIGGEYQLPETYKP